MKNNIVYRFQSKLKLNIKGKNIERFIRRLVNEKIELLNITYPSRNEVNIKIYKQDYERILELKSIYEVSVVDIYGIIKIKKTIKANQILCYCFLLGIGLLLFLSNIIFKIEIVHTNIELRNLLLNELENYGMKERRFKKNFDQITKIKKEILEKHKDKIEWLEIEVVGTKYVVRVEMRKIAENPSISPKQNVVAKKDAIVKRVVAESGQIIRNMNDYVKAGDVVISGDIYLNEEKKDTISARGTVYGEVWYETTVEYPFHYQETIETGKTKNVYVLKLLSKEIELFSFHPFRQKVKTETPILSHPVFPFSIVKQNQHEAIITDDVLNEEQAIAKAEALGNAKIKETLKEGESIIKSYITKVEVQQDRVILKQFFTVYEDITSYQTIVETPNEEMKQWSEVPS